jgi:hypothetical protein
VFNLLQQLEALGLSVPSVMQQLGLQQANGGTAPPAPAPDAARKLPS